MQVFFWVIAVLSLIATGYFTWRADVRKSIPKPWLTTALRCLLVALTWILLLAPSINRTKTETKAPTIVFLQDISASVPFALGKNTNDFLKERNAFLSKLKQKYNVINVGFGSNLIKDSINNFNNPSTDIASALTSVQEYYGQQNLGAIILATDGRFNRGEHPLFATSGIKSTLYAMALGDTATPKDLRISNVYYNKTVALNSQFEIRADIIASRCASSNVQARLMLGNTPTKTENIAINRDDFDKNIAFTLQANKPGLYHYTLILPALPGESNVINNKRDIFIEVVSDQKSIHIQAASPHPDVKAIAEALAGVEKYKLSVGFGNNLAGIESKDVVIIHGSFGNNQPSIAKKPIWYISAIGLPQNIVTAATVPPFPSPQREALPVLNTSFSAFNIAQKTAQVLDKMPPLYAVAGKVIPSGNTQSLVNNKTTNMPLWLVQQGHIPQAILLGEGLWRWRMYEYRYFGNHDIIDDFIRQTVALLAANTNEKPFRVDAVKNEWNVGESVEINAYLYNASGELVNTPEASLFVTDSTKTKKSIAFSRNGNAYKASIGFLPAGTYNYSAKTIYNGKTYIVAGSFAVTDIPVEQAQTTADYALLHSLSKQYNGHTFTTAHFQQLYDSILSNKTIQPQLLAKDDFVPLIDIKWLFFILLSVATTEWLLRKYWIG